MVKTVVQEPRFWGVACLCLLVFYPWDIIYQGGIHLGFRLRTPSLAAVLGTDALGRDIFLRCMESVRTVVLPLWVVTACSFIGGIGLAVVRHMTSARVLKLLDSSVVVFAAIPILLVCFAVSVWQEKLTLVGFAVTMGIVGLCKGYTQCLELYLRDQYLGYWQMHQVEGGSVLHRLYEYGIKQSWGYEFKQHLISFLQLALITEVALSYLGLGIPEPLPSLGNMIASHYDLILKGHWHPTTAIIGFFSVVLLIPSFAMPSK